MDGNFGMRRTRWCGVLQLPENLWHNCTQALIWSSEVLWFINGPILQWSKDFLSERKQQVLVTSGVPQSSVLGPLLFVVFINLIVEKADADGLFLFPDNLKVFKEMSSMNDVESLQRILEKMYYRTQHSLLKFHPWKCETRRVKNKRRETDNGMYNIDGTKLAVPKKVNNLGMVFDEHLTLEDHIHSKVNKANSLAGLL